MAILFSCRPVFSVRDKRLEINWRASQGDGPEYAGTHPADVFLAIFEQVARNVKVGWEEMRKLGWAMDASQTVLFSSLLAECAKAIEDLSAFIPAETPSPNQVQQEGG
jgi:hypothetical protein